MVTGFEAQSVDFLQVTKAADRAWIPPLHHDSLRLFKEHHSLRAKGALDELLILSTAS